MTSISKKIYTGDLSERTAQLIDRITQSLEDCPVTVDNGILKPSSDCPPEDIEETRLICDFSQEIITTLIAFEDGRNPEKMDDVIAILCKARSFLREEDSSI